jgi:CBS-domain-containing membrane protein
LKFGCRTEFKTIDRGRRVPDPEEAPMTVRAILDSKGTDVATIKPTANLASAIKLLAERRIGASVVVDPDQQIAGIISERDVIRELAERGAAGASGRTSVKCSPAIERKRRAA